MTYSYSIQLGKKTIRATLIERSGSCITFEVEGQRYSAVVTPELLSPAGAIPSATSPTSLATNPPPHRAVQSSFSPDKVATPLPGLVAAILVTVGQNVEAGTPLAVIEAMKMENSVPAPRSGTIKEVYVAVGQELSLGDALVRIE